MLIFCDLPVLGCLTGGHTQLSLSFVALLWNLRSPSTPKSPSCAKSDSSRLGGHARVCPRGGVSLQRWSTRSCATSAASAPRLAGSSGPLSSLRSTCRRDTTSRSRRPDRRPARRQVHKV